MTVEALLAELVELQRQQARDLRRIARAMDAARPYLTVRQAARLLQMSDDDANALLRRIGAIQMVDGRERVFAEDLLAELRARLDPSPAESPATPTAPGLHPGLARRDPFKRRRDGGKVSP